MSLRPRSDRDRDGPAQDRETAAVLDQARSSSAAERLAARLDRPLGVLGIVFVFVVLGQLLAEDPPLVLVFAVIGWVCWTVFVAEFVLRAHIAGWSGHFWRHNWWQLVFLALPFLRFLRALNILRFARLGGVVSAGVRSSRSAGRLLSGRVSWLASLTAIVVLASSQLHFLTADSLSYADALYQAALATITGTGLEGDGVATRLLRVVLAVYSVVVFATLAGSLGAYFLSSASARDRPLEEGDRS
jgi:voltage-gated potassium channel